MIKLGIEIQEKDKKRIFELMEEIENQFIEALNKNKVNNEYPLKYFQIGKTVESSYNSKLKFGLMITLNWRRFE